jgi:tetratricopeptide (TPR) repeat protein
LEHAGAERLQSQVLLSLAEVRQGQGRLEDAVELVEQGLELAGRLDQRSTVALANRQLAELHELRQEHDLADQRFHQALAILDDTGETIERSEYLAAYQRLLDARVVAAPLERSAG